MAIRQQMMPVHLALPINLDVQLSQCKDEFQKALNELTKQLATMIVKDGEGATKFVEVKVEWT